MRSSAASMIATRQGDMAGALEKNSGRRRASSTGMAFLSGLRSSTRRSGCDCEAIIRATGSSAAVPSGPSAGSGRAPISQRAAR